MVFENDIFDLASLIMKLADEHPDRIAVKEPYKRQGQWAFRTYTFKQLSDDTERVAAGLRAAGFKEHMRTVYMVPPSYKAAVISAALSRVGVITFMIDPSVGYRNVSERLSRIHPEAFIGIRASLLGRFAFGWGPRFGQKLVCLDGFFPGAITYNELIRHKAGIPQPPEVKPDDPAMVLYTTGSTGPAKPTMYLHRNFVNVFRTAHYSWRFHESEDIPVDMAAFPAFHMIAISAGGTMVVPPINFITDTPATTNPKPVCEVIKAAGVRSLFASPALLERIAHYANQQHMKLPTLERVVGGGAPVFEPLVKEFLRVMAPDGDVMGNYGATEALPSTEHSGREVLAETGEMTATGHGICVGKPFPGITLKVVGPVGLKSTQRADFTELPTGETGELIVQGPNISPAYFDDPISTKKNKLYDEDGTVWHRLGDAGHMDEKGRIWVEGRVNQCLQIGDQWITPMPIEAIFDQHPSIRRTGLVARQNQQQQPEAVLCVETWDPLNHAQKASLLQELQELVTLHPKSAVIQEFLFSNKLPTDPRHNAKIERPRLAQWAQDQLGANAK